MMGIDVLRGASRAAVRVGIGLGLVIAGVAFAGPLGTPFEELATEVTARKNAIDRPVDRTERKQKRALRKVNRALRGVDKGLKRDLKSAVQVSRKLVNVFPDDATFGPMLGDLLDDYATLLSNRVFAAEDNVDSAADPRRGYDATTWLAEAREIEGFAAAAAERDDHVARARHLRRLANRLIAAERAIAFVPPPVVDPVDPDGVPIDGTQGKVDFTVAGAQGATVAVDGRVEFEKSPGEFAIYVDASPSSAQLTGLSFHWRVAMGSPRTTYTIGSGPDDAQVSVRRGNVVFDRNTTGEIRISRVKFTGGTTPDAIVQATYRVSAQSAGGQQITVTGTIAIDDMPISGF